MRTSFSAVENGTVAPGLNDSLFTVKKMKISKAMKSLDFRTCANRNGILTCYN